MTDEAVKLAARWIRESRKIVVFTGAGISTESGIPDFRSPGGIWSKYNPDDLNYHRFMSGEKYRKIYWEFDRERFPAMKDALPNEGHRAAVEIEKSGRLLALITQNIDGLHAKAGTSPGKIFELHGTVWEVACMSCHTRMPREEVTERMERESIAVPYCDHCGGPLKVATVSFGQSLPAAVLEASFDFAKECDLFITIGSSLVVQPAAMLPVEAKRSGARLILVNLSETPYDALMDLIITGPSGASMAEIMKEFRSLEDGSASSNRE